MGGQCAPDDIGRIALEIMGCPDARVEARQGRFSREYPAFWESYPRLFNMCCEANTPAKRATATGILRMMLEQLEAGKTSGLGPDDPPTHAVLSALREKYVDPLVSALEREREREGV